MKLNKLEFLLMNNPLRKLLQKYVEIRRIRKYAHSFADKKILEIGCGSGYGSGLIKEYFSPRKIYATDLDKNMIAIAKKKQDRTIYFSVMDATRLKFKDKTFDAIFDLGVIHHIPNWRDCLKELRRVLKPRGQIIIEDFSIETFSTLFGRILKVCLKHPYNSMYTEEKFIKYLKKIGFTIQVHKSFHFGIRYFIIIAQKKSYTSSTVLLFRNHATQHPKSEL